MNNVLKALFFTGIMASLVVAMWFWIMSEGDYGLWVSLAVAVVFLALFVWVFFRPSEARDYFREMGVRPFEREGLCFLMVPRFDAGRGEIQLLLQNRYSGGCHADFLLRPSEEAAKLGLKRLRLNLGCEGSGRAREVFPWEVPKALEGHVVELALGATVRYPAGKGRLVRDRGGVEVGSVADVETGAWFDLFQAPARMTFKVPWDLSESNPQGQGAVPTRPAQDASPAGQAGTSSGQEGTAGMAPQGNPAAAAVDDSRVSEWLAELDADVGLRSHSASVRREKRSRTWHTVRLLTGVLLLGLLALAYGVLGFIHDWAVPGKLLALIGGAGFGFLGVLGLASTASELFTEPPRTPASSIAEVCERFYRLAFLNLKDGLEWLQASSECFPTSVVRQHLDDAGLPLRWRNVVEQHAAIDAKVSVEAVTAEVRARPGGRVADLQVAVQGTGIERVVFRNIAIQSQGTWFLGTAEPLTEAPARTGRAGEVAAAGPNNVDERAGTDRGSRIDDDGATTPEVGGCPHHYFFAKIALRAAFFRNPLAVFASLDSKLRRQSLEGLWGIVSQHCDSLGPARFGIDDLGITSLPIKGFPTLLIQMPEPTEVAEAYFVAMVLQTPIPALSLAKPSEGAYYLLERADASAGCPTMVCGYTADGAHVNYGPGPKPTQANFIRVLERIVARAKPRFSTSSNYSEST